MSSFVRAQAIVKNSEKKLCALLLFSGIMSCGLLYLNRSVTDLSSASEYVSLLLLRGEMIYRDFYYYVPPLYILRSLVIMLLTNSSVFWFRVIGIAERALLFVMIYFMLCRWTRPRRAMVYSCVGFFCYNSFLFNSYGDYTQTSQVLLVAACWAILRFTEAVNARDIGIDNSSLVSNALPWSALAGFFSANCIFCKQSVGIAGTVALAFSIFMYCLLIRKWKQGVLGLGFYVIGFVLGTLPYVIWLGTNGALSPFFEQVFIGGANAKGVSVGTGKSPTTSNVLEALSSRAGIVVVVLLIVVTIASDMHNRMRNTKAPLVVILTAFLLLVASIFFSLHLWGFIVSVFATLPVLVANRTCMVILVLMVLLALSLCLQKFARVKSQTPWLLSTLVISSIIFLSWIGVSGLSLPEIKQIEHTMALGEVLPRLFKMAFFVSNGLLVADFIVRLRGQAILPLPLYVMVAASDANAVISLVGGGTSTFSANGALLTVALSALMLEIWLRAITSTIYQDLSLTSAISYRDKDDLQVLLSSNHPLPLGVAFEASVLIVAVVVCFGTMVSRFACPYSFFGWTSQPIVPEANYTVDIPGYEGMRVSKRDKVTLEQITRLIELNTNQNDSVFSFAQGKNYNVFTNRLNHATFALVHYFDICPDNVASADARALQTDPPAMIIWKEYGEKVWESYESAYRGGGRLGQRDILDWFDSVKDTEYVCVGHVYNESIYLRKNKEVKYTFFAEDHDLVSQLNEVYPNQRNINLANGVWAYVSSISGGHIFPVIALILIFAITAIGAFGLFSNGGDWDLVALLLITFGLAMNISCVYLFIIVIPALGALFALPRSTSRFCSFEIVLSWLLVTGAALQWSSMWTVAGPVILVLALIETLILIYRGASSLRRIHLS